jgi:hypothetical protein
MLREDGLKQVVHPLPAREDLVATGLSCDAVFHLNGIHSKITHEDGFPTR